MNSTNQPAGAPAISLIMPSYNRANDLLHVLEAYERQTTREPFELIVVDDASKDETPRVLAEYRPQHYRLRAIRQEKNAGQGSARNRAIPVVEAPLTMFVGDDMFPDPELVAGHLAAHRAQPEQTVAFLGRVTWPDDLPVNTVMAHIDGLGAQQFSFYYLRDGREYDFRHLYTCNISLKTDFLRSLDHWFDTDFTLYGFEDVELGYRLSQRGLRIVYKEAMRVSHYHYHNAWSFIRRQVNSGLMSRVLMQKHPALRFQPAFRAQYKRFATLLTRPGVFTHRYSAVGLDEIDALTHRLLSFYEWTPNPLLDQLYLWVFDYYYYDGVLRGLLGRERYDRWGRAAHAAFYLEPALTWFIENALRQQVPLPPGYDAALLARIHARG